MTTYADILGVLARGGDIAADAAEHLGAVFAAEQTRYFLLNLHHPDSAIGLVVIERTLKSVRKARTWDRCLSRRSSRFLGLDFFSGPRFFARADGARGFWR